MRILLAEDEKALSVALCAILKHNNNKKIRPKTVFGFGA